MSVILASLSVIKVQPVEKYFGAAKVAIAYSPTDVNQPVGREQAARCIEQRLDSIAELGKPDTLLLAIENFIYKDGDEWRDTCLLGVRRAGGKTSFAVSAPEYTVLIPKQIYVDLEPALTGTTLKRTAGMLLSDEAYRTDLTCDKAGFKSDVHVNAQDWFKAVGATFDREEQIMALLNANSALLTLDSQ